MPRRVSVQFQKGQSLAEFTDRYGSEEQCRAALFQARWPQGFECPECGRKRCCRLRCRNVFQCTRSRHQVSLTASTVFANTKLPLTRWFLAMYLLTQSKNGLSAMALGRQLGVSYNTAWSLKHKLMQVMKERDESGRLGHIGMQRWTMPTWGAKPEEANADEGRRAFSRRRCRGGRAGHRRRPAGGKRMSCAERVPQAGDCGLGPPASAAGDGGLLGRTGLLPDEWRKRVARAPPAGNRRGTGQLRDVNGPGVAFREHGARQRQAGPGRHLPRLGSEICAALSCRILLPLQHAATNSLGSGSSTRSCRCADSSGRALSPVNCGWNLCVIRIFFAAQAITPTLSRARTRRAIW